MICHTCLHSMIQGYVNGDDKTEVVWCLKVQNRMVGRLDKCEGLEVRYDGWNEPKNEPERIDNVTQHPEVMDAINKDGKLSQSDRMKEYWKKKKGDR